MENYTNTAVKPKLEKSDLLFKAIVIANREDVESFTKMQIGGISPLGLLGDEIPLYFDKSVTTQPYY